MRITTFFRKISSKIKSSIYVFKKAEILENVLKKEINGEYDHISLTNSCELYDIITDSKEIRIAIYLGGALGDYIVYLNFVDELALSDNISITLFLDRIGFANFVYGKRKNITIVHDLDNYLFINANKKYDLSLHFDHGITIYHHNLSSIKSKSYDFYIKTCRMLEYVKKNRVDISEQQLRQLVIFKKAQFSGDNKWSKLSAGGVISDNNKYSCIILNPSCYNVLCKYNLNDKKYITINYGADKNMGGESQTKVVPSINLEKFIEQFKVNYPEYTIVQTGTSNSSKLKNVHLYAFDCSLDETAIILKNSELHIDSEGGLVHLASQLSTKCIVGFGPTPAFYYGYERNINIVSELCNNCMSVTNDWNLHCPKGQYHPECTYSITGELIFKKADEYLKSIDNLEYKIYLEKSDNTKADSIDIQINNYIKQNPFGKNIAVITKEKSTLLFEMPMSYNRITMYIDLPNEKYDTSSILWQKEMISKKIKLKYGTGINISCIDNTYDFIIFDMITFLENEYLKFETYFDELLRIAKDDSILIFYGDNVNYVYTNILKMSDEQKNKIIMENNYIDNNLNRFLKIIIRK
jgi:hypothetical protein